MVLHFHAVHAQGGHPPRPFRIAGHDHAGVAKGAQVLARVKAEAADSAQRPGALALVVGGKCLGGVLDDGQVVALGNAPERFHIGALSE